MKPSKREAQSDNNLKIDEFFSKRKKFTSAKGIEIKQEPLSASFCALLSTGNDKPGTHEQPATVDTDSDDGQIDTSSDQCKKSLEQPFLSPGLVKEEEIPDTEWPVPPKSPSPEPNPQKTRQRSNILSATERKIIISSPTRPQQLTKKMEAYIHRTTSLLNPSRTTEECWFHPAPPGPQGTDAKGNPRVTGAIRYSFTWKTAEKPSPTLVVNYGTCAKLVANSMTDEQLNGWINEGWHLSHLCGNWSCINPAHTTIESASVNCHRNFCFAHRRGCVHDPPCKKELKFPLRKDGLLVCDGGEESVRRWKRAYRWNASDDWTWESEMKANVKTEVKTEEEVKTEVETEAEVKTEVKTEVKKEDVAVKIEDEDEHTYGV